MALICVNLKLLCFLCCGVIKYPRKVPLRAAPVRADTLGQAYEGKRVRQQTNGRKHTGDTLPLMFASKRSEENIQPSYETASDSQEVHFNKNLLYRVMFMLL